jgi:glutathione S-transferase
MKLYSGPLSLFTAKVRIALDEKDLAYERVEVGWSLKDRYEPHHPDVVALNPKRQVPVLVDGDTVVYDSTLILEYLEDAYPEPSLRPGDPASRAACRQWEAWGDEILFGEVWKLIDGAFYPIYPEGGEAAAAELASARRAIAGLQRDLDKALVGREYLCGEYTFADIGCFVMVSSAATLGAPPAPELQSLAAWLARTGARPAVGRELAALTAYAAKARGSG